MRLKPPGFAAEAHGPQRCSRSASALAGISSLALTQAAPAMADPTETLVAVGSDTIQDVWNAFGTSFGGNFARLLQRHQPGDRRHQREHHPRSRSTAPGHRRLQLRPPERLRPGRRGAALRAEPGDDQRWRASPRRGAGADCIDIARSSQRPGHARQLHRQRRPPVRPVRARRGDRRHRPANCATANPASCPAFNADLGNGSTKSVTPVVTALTQANLFTLTDLTNLYANCQAVTEGGVTYWPQGSPNASPRARR